MQSMCTLLVKPDGTGPLGLYRRRWEKDADKLGVSNINEY
jgi:hypothetical protein